MNLSEILFERLQELILPADYPAGEIVPIEKQLRGTAFFPLGEGILEAGKWKHDEHYPMMVLAQDCGNEARANEVFASTLQSELAYGNTTWINLEKLLGKEAMKDCFFTTAIMGLRKSGQKDDQASYAFSTKGKDFLQLNLSFFREQLENADPDVIIALGLPVVHFLSAIFTREMHAFKELKSLKALESYCPKGYIDIIRDGNPLRIVFITKPKQKLKELIN
jgi:hypothetical protein